LSALGYARALLELDDQLEAAGLAEATIVVPNGSSGTHAGLAAGLRATGRSPRRVRGFSVLAEADAARAATLAMADAALDLLGAGPALTPDVVVVSDDQRGAGYGQVTPGMFDAVRLAARREGLLLDPVYSGKAFAGLLADLAAGRHAPGSAVLFLTTGGAPALFAYRRALEQRPA
jgi:D-cysteine desulfhydrase